MLEKANKIIKEYIKKRNFLEELLYRGGIILKKQKNVKTFAKKDKI